MISVTVAKHISVFMQFTTTALSNRCPLVSYNHADIVAFASTHVAHIQSECCAESALAWIASRPGM